MTELDTAFAGLRDRPMPDALDRIDQPVMSGLVALRERQTSLRSVSLACVVAGLVGLWTGVGNPARQQTAESLLGVPAAAPSSLLVD